MPPGSPIVVADGTPLLRVGVASTLRDAGYAVAELGATAADVTELVRRHAPEVLVVGALPDAPMPELVRRVRAVAAPVRVVLLLGPLGAEAIAELLGGVLGRDLSLAGSEEAPTSAGRFISNIGTPPAACLERMPTEYPCDPVQRHQGFTRKGQGKPRAGRGTTTTPDL